MKTKRPLRLLVAVVIIVTSAIGPRPRAAAEIPLPFQLVPGDVTTPAPGTPPIVPTARPDLLEYLAEDERQRIIARDSEWIAAERAEWLRLEAEREEWLRLERERARAQSPARRAPVEIAPGTVWALIDSAALRWGLDPVRFARIAWCESGGNPSAWNPSGASGPFQQMPQFWAGRAAAAGYPGASIWDLWVHVEVSAWLASTGGWSHWNPSRHCWG